MERIGIIFDRTRHRERGIAYTMVSRVRRGTDITLIGKVDVGMLNAV